MFQRRFAPVPNRHVQCIFFICLAGREHSSRKTSVVGDTHRLISCKNDHCFWACLHPAQQTFAMSKADKKKVSRGLLTRDTHTGKKKKKKMSRTCCTHSLEAFTPQQPFLQCSFNLCGGNVVDSSTGRRAQGKVPCLTAVLILEADCTWQVTYNKKAAFCKIMLQGHA